MTEDASRAKYSHFGGESIVARRASKPPAKVALDCFVRASSLVFLALLYLNFCSARMRPKPFLASLAQGRVVDKDARMYISKLLIFCFALLYTSWSVRIMARMIQIDKITAKGASMHCSHVFFYLICGVSRCSTHLGTRAAGRKHG